MGWIILVALILLAGGATVLLGVRRRLWTLAGAALMLGAAGYALQGRPWTHGRAPVPTVAEGDDGDALIALREAMFGRFTADGQYLVAADALSRAGERRGAVQVVLAGIRATPDSGLLWTGLGQALSRHDGLLSPPARFAFARARRLAPLHPGPPFFEGVAEVRAGNFAAARPLWVRALALTPPTAPYRVAIADRLRLLNVLIAASAP